MCLHLAIVALLQVVGPVPGPASAPGQPAAIDSGTRIRIRQLSGNATRTLTGTVVAADTGSIVLHLDRNDDYAPDPRFAALGHAPRDTAIEVPRSTIERLELSAGKTSNVRTGLLVGGVTGAAAGLVVGIATQCSVDESIVCSNDPGSILGTTAIMGAAGVGIGALIGALGSHEQWRRPNDEVAVRPILWAGEGRTRVGLMLPLPAVRQ